MLCPNCFQEVNDDMSYCPHCGAEIKKEETIYVDNPEVLEEGYHPGQYGEYQSVNDSYQKPLGYDSLGLLWCILAFMFPIVGLFIWFRNRKDYPNKAQTALTITIVSFAINLITTIFFS